jgi:hypothetical protein
MGERGGRAAGWRKKKGEPAGIFWAPWIREQGGQGEEPELVGGWWPWLLAAKGRAGAPACSQGARPWLLCWAAAKGTAPCRERAP